MSTSLLPRTSQKTTPRLSGRGGFRAPPRQGFGIPRGTGSTGGLPGTERTARPVHRANDRPQIHHGLGMVARPQGRREPRRKLGKPPLGGRKRRAHAEEACDHALDIAVDGGRRLPESNGGNGGGRVGADAGECLERLRAGGKVPAVPGYEELRATVEIARARVIAEALPSVQHLVELGAGQLGEAGPAREEGVEIGPDRGNRGLLQHDLAEPDAIGIGGLAGSGTPRQDAPVPVVPGKQSAPQQCRLAVAFCRGRACRRGGHARIR